MHDDIPASFRAMGSHEDALACLVILLTGPRQFYISREETKNPGVVVPRRFLLSWARVASRAIWLSFLLSISLAFLPLSRCPFVGTSRPHPSALLPALTVGDCLFPLYLVLRLAQLSEV